MIQQEQQPDLSVNQALVELHKLSRVIESSDSETSFKAIIAFVNLYIHNQKHSEQFFISLCEFNIVPCLFNSISKSIPTLQILQIFNLLLANTSKMSHLVYIFSQPIVHDFLFFKFSIQNQNSQTVQYYVQLLKTIIMKFSIEKQKSLIKLFCNNRFPHFPLLTAITSLASDYKQQVLTRVTANQCFLLLVNVMNQTKVGTQYLTQLQTIIYYNELLTKFLDQSEDQQRQTIRFLVDLILNLKNNVVSSAIFMNLLTNHVIFSNIGQPYRTLQFITNLYQQMLQNKEFPVEMAEQITLVLLTIVSKYYKVSHAINYTYYSAQKIIPNLLIPEKPNLSKFFEQRCKKIQDYLILQRPLFQQQKQLQFVKEQWQHLVTNTPESPVKQRKNRNRSSFISFFTSKDQIIADYVKAVMTKAGISDEKTDQPIYKLSVTANYQTALYLVQLVSTRFSLDYKLKHKKFQEMFEKDEMWIFLINQSLLLQIYRMCRKIHKKQLQGSRIKLETEYYAQSKVVKAQGFIYFIDQMKCYLKNAFFNLLGNHQNKMGITQLCLISAISSRLNLRELLDTESMRLLLNKLQQLQAYISDDVFSQQNFHFILKYIYKKKEKSLLKKIERAKQCQSPLSPKKKFYQVRVRVQRNFILYQVIKRIINSSVKSLAEFIEEYWNTRFFSQKEGQSFPITQFLCKDSNGSVLEVIAGKDYEFVVKKSKKDQQSVTYSILRDDCTYDKENPTYLSFEGNQFFLDLQTEQKAHNFREDLQRLRKTRTELIMNGIIQYLTFSYSSLASYCNLKTTNIFNSTTPR